MQIDRAIVESLDSLLSIPSPPLTSQTSHVTLEDGESRVGSVYSSDLHLIRSDIRHLSQLQHLHRR